MKVIRFSAIWCAGCLVMKARWSEVFNQYSNLEIIDYDYDMNPDEVIQYQIGRIIPVIIIMKGDIEVKRIIGEKSKKELALLVEEVVGE